MNDTQRKRVRTATRSFQSFSGLLVSTILFILLAAKINLAQNAGVNGRITDASGAVVIGAKVEVTNTETGITKTAFSNDEGNYVVGLLKEGKYEIRVELQGFKPIKRSGIQLEIHQVARIDFVLEIGELTDSVEVFADASPLNFETAERKDAVTPQTIQTLPLLVSGTIRSAASFITLMPGVNTGGSGSPFDARINGGLQTGDEAVVDGVSMQEGLMSQSGMIAFSDYPISPESVSEVSILTSNYEPQYGSTTSAVITATTKSGTNEFHGGLHWFHRNTVLNARQFGVAERPKDLEHDFGVYVGGPVKLPLLWTPTRKTYFFFNYTGFRIRGSLTKPVLSVPTERMRQGDFGEWPDPIFDPLTTRANPTFDSNLPVGSDNLPYLRDQFMGCDPIANPQPNVICADRIANSMAHQWFRHVPSPNRPGVLNNFEAPSGPIDPRFKNSNSQVYRFDHYIGNKDQFSGILRYRRTSGIIQSQLPQEIATDNFREPDWNVVARFIWDRTFSPRFLNHFAFGFSNFRSTVTNISDCCLEAVPSIPGVFRNNHQPALSFEQYESYGGNSGGVEDHPTSIVTNLTTWVRGNHTFKFGGEYRDLRNWRSPESNESGSFNFSRLNTGLIGVTSGNAMASFLLEAVNSASATFRALNRWEARGNYVIGHFGDTWKVTPKLSLNYGIRFDRSTPSSEKDDQLSFFDPLGPNAGAGGRQGRLAFAGTEWGEASFGRRHPEETFNKGFAPRLGIAYSPGPRTVVRAGYGLFYTQAFYPGWNGGIALDGFEANVSFASTLGGLAPAFVLSNGFPQNFTPPPSIDSAFRNGQDLTYRPFDANRLSYSQQWNLTIEHQFTDSFHVTAAYVGNKGTRLPSVTAPLNALDPQLLSMGSRLFDEFSPGVTELHGVPLPYEGWVEQMTGCAPSVAQALLPFPQFCSSLQGLNENAGNSTYHSFQFKAERRFTKGLMLLASYTLSKNITDSDFTQMSALTWSGTHGVISPFERQRNKGLAVNDVPQILSLSMVYELPVGKGKRWLSTGGILGKVLGGWEITNIFRASTGIPFFIRSGNCNVPAQFRAGCIPGILPGADPFAQDKGNFDPNQPLLNRGAFEPADSFNFYFGQGPRISDFRGFAYHNHDFGLIKTTSITETVALQIRGEFFNVWNWHKFSSPGTTNGIGSFDTNLASPAFGMWNGAVTPPRNIQIGVKIIF